MGLLAIARCYPMQLGTIVQMLRQEPGPLLCVEQEVLGFHHGQAGAFLAREWGFGSDLYEAILYLPTPEQAGEGLSLIHLIHAADCLTRQAGLPPVPNDQTCSEISASTQAVLALPDAFCRSLSGSLSHARDALVWFQ